MPAVVIAVSMLLGLVLMGPSKASQPCMSRTDARQHSGSVQLYRHGQDQCWDAVTASGNHQLHEIRRVLDQPGLDDAIPQTVLDDARWINVDQAAPPSIIERKPGPTDLSRDVVLVAIIIVLMLGTIEVLFRGTISLAGGAATGRSGRSR